MDATGHITIVTHNGVFDYKEDKVIGGEEINRTEIHNIIVDNASKILTNRVCGNDNYNINIIKIGTDKNLKEKHDITDLASSNIISSDINEKFFVDSNGQYVYDTEKNSNGKYAISGVAFCTEKNSLEIGNIIMELGLYSNNNMFSYKKLDECSLPPNTTISIIWKIIF